MIIRSRLAPTPSGYLHWGNLYNFALTWGEVRAGGGALCLRIDDLDATRARTEYVEDIFRTLEWLGFDWDEGPEGPADFQRHHSQSLKLAEYRSWLARWPGYACACSRQDIQARTTSSYDGFCRERALTLTPGQSAWRARSNDVVLWRKDDLPAYHLVSLVEDIKMGINLVVRGEDLRESSDIQLQLAQALGEEAQVFRQARFVHHPLLRDATGNKLSKSAGAGSLKQWREAGKSAAEAWRHLAAMVGRPCVGSLQEFSSLD